MLRKWIVRILVSLGAVALIAAVLVGAAVYDIWRQNTYKSVIQALEVPSLNNQFVLLTDIAGFDDRAWYVYQLPLGTTLTKEMKTANDKTGVLFWNYSEAGEHHDNPQIEIVKERFLVFSRGGLKHSLYDLKTRTVLVNDISPLVSFAGSEQYKKCCDNNLSIDIVVAEMNDWVKKNLHQKIERIVKNGG